MTDTSNEVVRWLADQSMHDAAMAEVSARDVEDVERRDKLRSDSASHRQRAATLLALMAERNEIESVITVWRGHTQRAEAERDRLMDALLIADTACRSYWGWEYGRPGDVDDDDVPDSSLLVKWRRDYEARTALKENDQ